LFSVTVQALVDPETTEAGEQLRVEGTIGATRLRVALVVLLFKLAVIIAALSTDTADTVAAKTALVAPAATLTEAGIVTNALLSESATTAPPVGARLLKVTVQEAVVPEPRVAGVHANEVSVTGGVRLIVAVLELPFKDAVTVTVCAAAIAPAVALNVPVVEPATTVSDDGTVTIALSSVTEIRLPPTGAALFNVTVQVLTPPDTKLAGAQTSDDTCARALRLIDDVVEPEP
jgi:hypothetical protein